MKPETITLAIKYLRSAGFPGNHSFSKEKTAVWLELFSDIPDGKFIKAIQDIVKTTKFFPTVAEIRERVFKSTGLLADAAWGEVLDQMEKVCGTSNNPTFSNHITERVVRSLGGLDTIWKAGTERESYYRTMFFKSYDSISAREHEDLMIGEPTQEEATKLLDEIGLEIKGIK